MSVRKHAACGQDTTQVVRLGLMTSAWGDTKVGG